MLNRGLPLNYLYLFGMDFVNFILQSEFFMNFKISAIFSPVIYRLIPIFLILIIGLSHLQDYGISTDEKNGINSVKWHQDLLWNDRPIEGILKYNGTVFNFLGELIYQIYDHSPLANFLVNTDSLSSEQAIFKKKIIVKHYLTFSISLIAYACISHFLTLFFPIEYSFLGSLNLALIPRFWGHSFFNFKDIPFASIFTLISLLGSYWILNFHPSSHCPEKKPLNVLISSLMLGTLIGFLSGIRFGGFVILGFFPLIYFILQGLPAKTKLKEYFKQTVKFAYYYGVTILGWITTTILAYPVSWSNPLRFLVDIFHSMTKYEWRGEVLFLGKSISVQNLPWFYLPTWFLITIPPLIIVLAVGGIIHLLFRYSKLNPLQQIAFCFLILQLFFIPAVSILKGSIMYDEMRHFIFILASVAFFSSYLIIIIYQKIKSKFYKLFYGSLGIVLAIGIMINMMKLHPYQYTYFNSLVGGLQGANGKFETDYWGLSMKEGIQWINTQATLNSTIIIGGYIHTVQPFSRPDLKFLAYDEGYEQLPPTSSFYYLARLRGDNLKKFPHCPIVYQVKRENTPLTTVKYCS